MLFIEAVASHRLGVSVGHSLINHTLAVVRVAPVVPVVQFSPSCPSSLDRSYRSMIRCQSKEKCRLYETLCDLVSLQWMRPYTIESFIPPLYSIWSNFRAQKAPNGLKGTFSLTFGHLRALALKRSIKWYSAGLRTCMGCGTIQCNEKGACGQLDITINDSWPAKHIFSYFGPFWGFWALKWAYNDSKW